MLDVVVRRVPARRRGRLHILTAHVGDATGEIRATWFNQPWLETKLTPGTRVRMRGKQNRFGFQVSSFDLGDAAETADFAPVYPSTADLAQKTLRTLTDEVLAFARDVVSRSPPDPRGRALPLRADAFVRLHRPRGEDEAEQARRRLALDELLTLQLALRRRAAEREELVAEPLPPPAELARALPRRCCRSRSPRHRSTRSRRSTATSRGRRRCSASCRATSAPGRPRSRCTRCCAPSRRAARAR